MSAAAVDGAEAEHDGGGDDGECAEQDLGDVFRAGAFQFAEQQAPPEDADQRVGVPERKRDREADVANGEHGEGVGHRPQHAGEYGDGDEVPVLGQVGEDAAGSFDQRGKRPSRREHSGHHAQARWRREKAGVDQLGGSFGGPQPDACAEAAENADAVHRSKF